jgi:protein-tyrosine phosphatase
MSPPGRPKGEYRSAQHEGSPLSTPPLRVLFVCMGNICRSPTAEGVLRHKLKAAGLADRVEVESAATHGYHVGAPPDARAVTHALRRGYDLSSQRARRVLSTDFEQFDFILAMDEDNLAELLSLHAEQGGTVPVLLMDHAPDHPRRSVPDPYYGRADAFETVLDTVEAGCEGLIAQLRARLG